MYIFFGIILLAVLMIFLFPPFRKPKPKDPVDSFKEASKKAKW